MFAGAGTNPGEKTLEDKFFEKEVCSTHYSHLPIWFHICIYNKHTLYTQAGTKLDLPGVWGSW